VTNIEDKIQAKAQEYYDSDRESRDQYCERYGLPHSSYPLRLRDMSMCVVEARAFYKETERMKRDAKRTRALNLRGIRRPTSNRFRD
jgi:hypothetical protein